MSNIIEWVTQYNRPNGEFRKVAWRTEREALAHMREVKEKGAQNVSMYTLETNSEPDRKRSLEWFVSTHGAAQGTKFYLAQQKRDMGEKL